MGPALSGPADLLDQGRACSRRRKWARSRSSMPSPSAFSPTARSTLPRCGGPFAKAVSDIGLIMLIILMSGMIGFAIIFMQLPQQVAGVLLDGIANPHLIVAIILLSLFPGRAAI